MTMETARARTEEFLSNDIYHELPVSPALFPMHLYTHTCAHIHTHTHTHMYTHTHTHTHTLMSHWSAHRATHIPARMLTPLWSGFKSPLPESQAQGGKYH